MPIGIDIPYGFKVVIEGIRGDGNTGDIAVDDISMTKGTCSDCDFDNGFCHWTQVDNDDFDWTLNEGQTQTSNTGPSSDHTSGNGRYIYIESSIRRRGDVAWLLSPFQHAGKYCFSFWYYMYGEHVDRLRVGLWWYINGTGQALFRTTGNQGNNWIPGNIIVKSTTDFQVVLEGRIKNATYRYEGDIAVDDVLMTSCQDCDNPIPNHAVANSKNFEYGSVIEITCNMGYNLTGVAQMVCQAGGTWSSPRPVCKPYDCKHRNISNGDFIAPNGTTFGQTASQVCSKGYTLNGDTAVTCTSFGWNGTAGTCTIVDCGNPTPTYANVNSTNFEYGSMVEITCNTGYNITGESLMVCLANGSWSSSSPTCEPFDCGNPTPTNANVNSTSFKYGSVIEITCNKGYNITGESVMVCLANGSWSSGSPTCEPFDCGNRTLLNGQFSAPEGTTFGQTATHVCNIGYFLVGDTTVSCTDSGWKGIAGICEIEGMYISIISV
ncbi:sushi, von Willebrand factor type A, EGF and pentraxin domain-containing protein 1-like [Mercenaria mercenaria]|uniref:sushi, von Willebrand factor type A, EGF and pentraxin domain-containing protein 1-like n=1 Tax=Mercenaria mercenaria TaxID=6596 RepID=UPI00234F9AB1|nr:sushi, von Willebrand factor type A, EGF and pentraxin domain-containing protein 1-like [Mercenaria mercenaria]